MMFNLIKIIIMENYIVSRAILVVFTAIHLFVLYVGASGLITCHINKLRLRAFFITELVLFTVFIVYDCIAYPPVAGWLAAIFAYLFIYSVIIATWLLFSIHAILEKDVYYDMKTEEIISIRGDDYIKGFVVVDNDFEADVVLPWKEYEALPANPPEILKVKFKEVLYGFAIVVVTTA